jgi:hypothetical protein
VAGIVTRRVTEAVVERTHSDIREMVQTALSAVVSVGTDQYLNIEDITDAWVVYGVDGCDGTDAGDFKRTYTIDDAGKVTLSDPVKVVEQTTYTTVTEATVTVPGRVLEAKGTDAAGGRIFRVEIVGFGDSKNRTRYSEAVVAAAAPLYDGAKAFDHHRTEAELRSSTIAGLIGTYTGVAASGTALAADLCLLPSATHTAEALDASLAAQAKGLPPLVGISHDITGKFRPIVGADGQRVLEAVEITSVNSADVVADPSAGGRATRMVAGGSGATEPKESTMTLEELLAMLAGATPEQRATAVAALGIDTATLEKLATAPPVDDKVEDDKIEPKDDKVLVGAGVTESAFGRNSIQGRSIIRTAVTDAGLDVRLAEAITAALPERFTEAHVDAQIEGIKRVTEGLEKINLIPTVPDIKTTGDERDRKAKAVDDMLNDRITEGYRSVKAAYVDITGNREDPLGEDFNRRILADSYGGGFDSASARQTESASTSTWGFILGDAITRRMVAEYAQPSLQTWRQLVSSTPSINDFRTQRIDRLGGYGVLPAVNEGAPYQNLVTPTDEESSYKLTKRGGLDDLTLEAIANDDLRLVQRIPKRLGLAAAQTLYRFVFDMLDANITCTFDSTALFAAGHGSNTASLTLGQTGLAAARLKMSKQAAYGDTKDLLDVDIKYLVVPSDLWEMAWQLSTSAVALPTTGVGAANTPNINQSIVPIRVPYFTTATSWYAVADPNMVPTIEVGFYQGRQDPELFSQVDPNVGSVFSADKVTYKIRHIYSGTVVDFRGFFRGTA